MGETRVDRETRLSLGGSAIVRIVVTDPIISRFADVLTSDGTDGRTWVMAADWSDQHRKAALGDADIVVCRRLTADEAAQCVRARLVQVTGAGYEQVAIEELPPGVAVANAYCHGSSIAEHVLMVAMMLLRRAIRADREMRQGVWRTIATDPDVEFGATLSGRTLGLVGLGEIGGHVARRAHAMGMRTRAVRARPDAAQPSGTDLEWIGGVEQLSTLAAASDVLVVTVPLSERTRGIIDAAVFDAMAPSGLVINVSRGPVIDEQALYDALLDKRIAGAGIDVWWGEGTGAAPSRLPFAELDNVVVTPHQSGHTLDTFEGRARDIAANIEAVAHGQSPSNLILAR